MSDTDATKPPVVGNVTFQAGDSQASKLLRAELDVMHKRHGNAEMRLDGLKGRIDELEHAHHCRLVELEEDIGSFNRDYTIAEQLSVAERRLDGLEAKLPDYSVGTRLNAMAEGQEQQVFDSVEALSKVRQRLDALDASVRKLEGQRGTQATNRQHVGDDAPREQPTIYTGKRTPPPTQVAHGDIWIHPERGRLKDEFGLWVPAPEPQPREVDVDEIKSLEADNARLREKADAAVRAEKAVREQLEEAQILSDQRIRELVQEAARRDTTIRDLQAAIRELTHRRDEAQAALKKAEMTLKVRNRYEPEDE